MKIYILYTFVYFVLYFIQSETMMSFPMADILFPIKIILID